MTKFVIGLMVCQILWQSRQSRFAAEAACAGGRGDWRRKAENQICHRPESGYRKGSTTIDRRKTALTKGFHDGSRANRPESAHHA